MKTHLEEDLNAPYYEPDDGPLTLEQINIIQKVADDRARAEGKTPPSEIPKSSWEKLF